MCSHGKEPPGEGRSITVGPGNAAVFYQACDDIQRATFEIYRMIEVNSSFLLMIEISQSNEPFASQ